MLKKIKYIILIFNVFFVFCFECKSLTYGGCEYSDISRLKSLVSNVNLSYDYYMIDNKVYFNITLNNIIPGVYFVDSQTGIKYNYDNTVDGEITIVNYKNENGNYKFYSELSECYGIKLGNKYYNLPTYNQYYNDPLCENNRNYNLCQKWQKVPYSYGQFKNIINEYNESKESILEPDDVKPIYEQTYLDVLVKFYIDYYYIILIGIIIICVTIMVISKKKNSFDL